MKEKKEKKIEDTKEVDEVEKLKADVEHWKNEYYRAYADMQNLRKLMEKDHKEAIKYRIEGFVDEIIGVLDSFHFALQAEAKTEEMKNFLIGFEYIYRNLVSILENEGVNEFSPKVGDKFDPLYMQAIESRESDEKPNTILEVKVKGYKLHEHLVRPAIVIVSKQKEEKPSEDVTKDA